MTENQPQSINVDEQTTVPAGPEGQATAPGALTDDDKKSVRSAAILAGVLVSGAEPGFFDSIRESMAASKALQSATPEVQQLMKTGGFPEMPEARDKAGLEAEVLRELAAAKQLLMTRAPGLVEGYRAFVLQSCRDVAEAAKGTSGTEQGVIAKVEQALA